MITTTDLIPTYTEALAIFGGDSNQAMEWAAALVDQSVPLRDKLALRAWAEGMSTRAIGAKIGVSGARVHQILYRMIGPLTEEKRAELREEWNISS